MLERGANGILRRYQRQNMVESKFKKEVEGGGAKTRRCPKAQNSVQTTQHLGVTNLKTATAVCRVDCSHHPKHIVN